MTTERAFRHERWRYYLLARRWGWCRRAAWIMATQMPAAEVLRRTR